MKQEAGNTDCGGSFWGIIPGIFAADIWKKG